MSRPSSRLLSVVLPACVLALGVAFVSFGSSARATEVDPDYRLSSLRVFNRVVLLVKEQYVEPQRIRPKEMLLAALDSVEKSVPEVLVEETPTEAVVTVGTEVRNFRLDDVTSLWELSFALRDVFRFLETRISPEVDRREVEYAAVNGMLSKLDPHSVLLEPRFSQEMKLNTKGEFGGLGIVISIRESALTVISPIDGTPADRAGVKAQDKIVKIGEESTVNMGLDEAVERLRGKPGTPVVIWILRKGWEEPQKYEIVRDKIKVDSVTHQALEPAPGSDGPRLGYVKVKQFQGHTADDVANAVAAMEKTGKLGGLVLDLRNNPGGLLDQSVEVSNLFLKDGVIVVTQEGGQGGERREIRAQPRANPIELPVVVLVNGGSASASEIVAGALKNRNRAVIVGDQTFGKGSVQQLYDFPDQSSLKLTIGQYLTPGDESIQSVGITPDVHVLAILAHSKDELNLLPDEHTREEDLDRHLDDARIKKSEARYKLAYLAEAVDEAERERRDASTKFEEDFEIRLSRRLLEAAPFTARERMLEAMKPALDDVTTEEEKKIDAALLKLGVDWTRGNASGGKLAARVISAAPVTAGGTLKLTVEAQNIGSAPLYRVRANTNATIGLFSDRELLFGKLDPGALRSWSVEMKVPKELQSRRDLIRLAFTDDHTKDGKELARLDVPIAIDGVARPRFSYALFIDDVRGGNGDGLLQAGESVDLVVRIKNTGQGASEEPMALLKNLGAAEAFIETGRQKLDQLAPGSAGVARFAFKVQPDALASLGSAPKKVDLRLQVFDAVTGDVLVERLQFPIKASAAHDKKAKKGVVEATAPTTILAAADTGSAVLAKAQGGARFDALGEVNGFTRVKIGNLIGYVESKGVSSSKGKVVLGADGEPQGLSLVYGRDPPRITFASGSVATVEGDTFTVEARIEDDGPVKDAYLYVGDQKVHYEQLHKDGRSGAGPRGAATSHTVRHEVKLKPGVNIVTLFAREDDEFAQRETLTVYSKKGDPLADRK